MPPTILDPLLITLISLPNCPYPAFAFRICIASDTFLVGATSAPGLTLHRPVDGSGLIHMRLTPPTVLPHGSPVLVYEVKYNASDDKNGTIMFGPASPHPLQPVTPQGYHLISIEHYMCSEPGMSFNITVRAMNSYSWSASTALTNLTIPSGPPSLPRNLTFLEYEHPLIQSMMSGPTSAIPIQFEPPLCDNNYQITGFGATFRKSVGGQGQPEPWGPMVDITPRFTTDLKMVALVPAKLVPNVVYEVAVAAKNEKGWGANSHAATWVSEAPIGEVPPISAYKYEPNYIYVAWEAPTRNPLDYEGLELPSGPTYYWVRIARQLKDGSKAQWDTVTGNTTQTSWTINSHLSSPLLQGVKYVVQLAAHNGYVWSYWNNLCVKTDPNEYQCGEVEGYLHC